MDTCTAEFARLTRGLVGLRCDGAPFITLPDPFKLQHWSMPVIEALLIVGAIACLIHALRRRRDHGDSSNLVVWVASIFALLMVEPIAYFPQWFGLENSLGLTFVHNQFSVQFLFDRLPLYVVAMYPVYTYVAYVLIQRTGILNRYHPIVGATCVAFTFIAWMRSSAPAASNSVGGCGMSSCRRMCRRSASGPTCRSRRSRWDGRLD